MIALTARSFRLQKVFLIARLAITKVARTVSSCRAIENFIEDPLAEELLKGEFQGKDVIEVEVKEVADKKQLVFEGKVADAVPVGAGSEEHAE